jgi:hypothetical protein
MPRQKCALCDEPYARQMMSVYWRWTWPSGDQRGWVQKYDPVCANAFVGRLGPAAGDPNTCIKCGTFVAYPNQVLLLGYVYIPKRDRIDLELPHCEECFMKSEAEYTQGGRRLEDRGIGGEGALAPNPADDPWAALGLHP